MFNFREMSDRAKEKIFVFPPPASPNPRRNITVLQHPL
jgi:hypothetical protein